MVRARETLRESVRLCHLVISEATAIVPPTWLHKHELNMDDINDHVKLDREQPVRPKPCTENYRQLKRAVSGEGCLPQGRIHLLVWPVRKSQS